MPRDPEAGVQASRRPGPTGTGLAVVGLLAALLLLAVPLTGCLEGGGTADEEAQRTMTALDGLGYARAVAAGWDREAELGAIVTKEGAREPERWSEDAFEYVRDTSVGDGESPQWAYVFVLGDNETKAVYANVVGETYVQTQRQSPFEQPIEDWRLDSPHAVGAALQDENFTAIARAEDAVIEYSLLQGDQEKQAPVWWLHVSSDAMQESHSIFVDARSGETHAPSRGS